MTGSDPVSGEPAEQRDEVIARQATEPDRLFGEIAVESGYIDDVAVDRYLDHRDS